jgi:hypothetical protein
VGAPVTPAGVGAAERTELLAQRPVPVRLDQLVALGGAVLPDQLARHRWETPNTCWRRVTARRRRAGLTSFPGPAR